MKKYNIEIDVPLYIGYEIEAHDENEAVDRAYEDFFKQYSMIEDAVNKYFDGRGDTWYNITEVK